MHEPRLAVTDMLTKQSEHDYVNAPCQNGYRTQTAAYVIHQHSQCQYSCIFGL